MLLRVRCVDDGRELLIEGRRLEWRVQVADIKRLVLAQRRQRLGGPTASVQDSKTEAEDEEALGSSFLLFQGCILPDSDAINLFSLTPADFFVFVVESDAENALAEENAAEGTEQERRQLLSMGFTRAQVDKALSHGRAELEQLVERIMSDSGGPELAFQPVQRSQDACGLSELREKSLADPFDAVMLLKEQFSERELAKLIESPAATVQTLRRAPIRSITRSNGVDRDDSTQSEANAALSEADEESKRSGDGDSDPVERLAALGFDRDLAVAVYESCGFDEQLAANALLQTLET